MDDPDPADARSLPLSSTRRGLLLGAGGALMLPRQAIASGGTVPAAARGARRMVIRGGTVVTIDPALGTFDRADLLVENGRIRAIAPDIADPDAEVIDATSMIVMPGFVDGHRHLWEGLIRDTLPTEDLSGYVSLVNRRMGPAFTAEDAYLGTLVSALGALDAGVTTVLDWSHISSSPAHTEAVITALRESGLRAVFGYGKGLRNDLGSVWPDDLLQLKREHFASPDQLLTLGLATTSPELVPVEVARAHFKLAREADVLVSVHAGLSGMGRPDAIGQFGREGLLGPAVNLVHCNTLSRDEWKMIADTGTSVSISPEVEMQMGHGIPPIQQARDVGVKPSLGVDVETSAPGDLWTQMRVIYALQRMNAFALIHSGKPTPPMMTPREVLEYATVAGAKATLLDHKTGTLTPGREADIILLRTDMLNVAPVTGVESAIVLGMDARNVDTVLVAGRVRKRGGRMPGVDLPGLRTRLAKNRDRVLRDAKLDRQMFR